MKLIAFIRNNIPLSIFFIFTTLFYLHNLTRTVYGGDVGDLAAAALSHGVPHPPGYPLFTLLGIVFLSIPLSLPPVTKIGLISVISALLTLGIFYKLISLFVKDNIVRLLSLGILAFSYYFWFYAELPEVFSLGNLFAMSIILLSILFYKTKEMKYLYFLAFTLG